MTMNSGTTPSWVGIAIVAMTKTSSGPRPRKRSLAKEYPASVEKMTTERDCRTATVSELMKPFINGMFESKTRPKLSKRLPSGSNAGIGLRTMVIDVEDASWTT